MADVSVTINPPNSTSVTIGNVVTSHASSHAPGANDSIESYYYPRSNPSGYATSGDFATTGYVGEVSGYLYGQIAFPSNVVFTTGSQTIGGTKNFSTRPTVNGTGVLLSGEASIGSTGYLSGYVQKTETGNFLTSSQTGEFYPRSNPSGYITGVNLSAYQTIAASTGISGYLQGQISAINVASGQFLTTGAADDRYVNVSGDTIYGSLTVTGTTSGHSFALDPTGYIDFQYGVPSHKEGRVFYDINFHSLCYFNDEPDVMLNIGQEQVVRVSNGWTGNILNGWVVYASGAVGNRPAVYPASAVNSTELYRDIIGVATHDISNQGYITTLGLVNSLNTTGFSEGQTVYLSTQSGLLTSTKPIPPNHAVKVGIITRSHQTQGQLFVNIDQGNHLGSLHDVNSTGVQNHDLIRYNSASGYWENFQANFVTGNVVRPNETGVFLTGETDPIFLASTAYSINSTLTGEWGESYRDSITGINIAGTSSKTITLYQRDGTTLTANFTDIEGTGDGGTDYFLTGASFNSGDGNLSLYVNDGSVITESFDGRYVTGNVVRPSETGGFLVSSDLNEYQTIVGSTGISGYLQGQINSIDLSPTGSFLTTGAGDGRYYPLSSNPSSYLIAADIANLASTGYVTGVSGHLQSQISAIDLSNLESATGNLNVRVSAIENVSGDFALKANTGAFLTTGAGDFRYYPLSSNPSSYLVASDITHLASTGYVTGVSGHLQGQISAIDLEPLQTATGNLNTRVSSIEGITGGFALSSSTGAFLTTGAGDSRYIQPSQTGVFYSNSNPSGYITGINLQPYALVSLVTGVSGYLDAKITSLESQTGLYVTGVVVRPNETGNFITNSQTGQFYPIYNPSGYITGVDLSNYATIPFVTGVSGYHSGLIALLYAETGSYVLSVNTGSFLTTGAGDNRYVLQSATGAYTGEFYPRHSNPSGYITGVDLSSYATTVFVTGISGYQGGLISSLYSATGLYALKSSTGSFLATGAGDARYYPLATNPSGYLVVADIANLATTGYVTSASGYLQGQISSLNSLSGQTSTGYNRSITGITVGGTDTKTITLYQQNGGTISANFSDLQSSGESSSLLYQEVYIDAGAMTTGISGASPTGIYIGSADISFDAYSFGAGANSFSQFKMVLPSNWSTGDTRAKFHWTALNGSTGHVRWSIQSRAVGNDDAISGAWGTSQEVVSQFITGYDNHVTSGTSQISFSNDASIGDSLYFRVGRNADHATDTFGLSSYLKGISIQYKISGASTQW